MHFWINKSSQGCGFNGRYVPPSISSGTRRNQCSGLYPKPMVTPVHRFQSIESVASGGHRHSRAPPFHTRFPGPQSTHSHINIFEYPSSAPAGAPRSANGGQRTRHASTEYVSTGDPNTITPNSPTTSKLKCGVWAVIGLIPFFVVAAKYYFNGENMGMEALTFCAILILVLLVGGFLSLFEAFGSKRARRCPSVQISSEQNETFEESSQVPTNVTELPPPPYHLAVMLPSNNERLAVIQDSPPPTYEKAVT